MAPLIKLSKLSHWPAVEINSKQGAPASQVMNILQTACRGDGGAADRASMMRMTLKVAENRKILSFFICMQIRLLHKLTPEPRCQSSSWVEAGTLPVPNGRYTHPHFPSQVSGGFKLSSRGKYLISFVQSVTLVTVQNIVCNYEITGGRYWVTNIWYLKSTN